MHELITNRDRCRSACQQAEASVLPSPANIELVIALIVGAGLRTRAALEPHSTLGGDLGFDWIDRECIAIAVEDHFEIVIDEATVVAWQTLADIARTAEAGQASKAAGDGDHE